MSTTINGSGDVLTLSAASMAAAVYQPSGTGAVNTTVQAKLRESVSVKDFGAVGDGVTDDTVALQNALNAASGKELKLDGLIYKISKGAGSYVLTAPADVRMVGVRGKTTLKLSSAASDCYILGTATSSTYFECSGVTFDGNKATLSSINVSALYFPESTTVISKGNTFKDLNDTGAFSSKAIYVSNTTLAEYAESSSDTWTGCEGYPFQTYRTARNIVRDGYAKDVLISFTDINGQTIPSTIYAKTLITDNVVVCDAAFGLSYSVLSLMGNDVECVGNKINGGGTQIVVHSGTTDVLYNYRVAGNFLWQSKGIAIGIYQSSGTTATNGNVTVIGNMIYQPTKDAIYVSGNYAGGATVHTISCSVVGNTIYDYLTDTPSPSSFACIHTLGVVNTVISSNTISGPRWAGILCEYDGRNIDIIGNVIADHQGRTNTGGGTASPQAGAPIFLSGGTATAYLGNINVAGNVIRNYGTQVSPQASYVRTGGIVVNEAKSQDISIRGNRVMTGNTSGISLYACVNVTVMDNEVTGYYSEALNTASGVGTGCQLAYAISGPTYAATGSRPTLQSTQAGYSMWDSTLTKPIWWNGSVWKDANNTTV